jgi:1,2-diacylglycerol 3-beta-galactosyltransferase
MSLPPTEQEHIVFLFSDTGGGHRSAAEAIIEALDLEFPGQFTTEMVDIFREYAPPPLHLAPQFYPPLSRMPDVWRFGYRVSNGRQRTRLFSTAIYPYVRRGLHRLVKEHPCDLIVSVHPFANTPVLRAMRKNRVPFVTVVTDMVSTHSLWFDSHADFVIVPTESARQSALKNGLREEQLAVVGLPVANRFCLPAEDKSTIRERLGWPKDIPIILLVGGGEGMGPLERTAHAIDEAGLQVGLIVIAGRNRGLKRRLETHNWHMPMMVYGFIRDMPNFMRAADILVSKAGPGTICEAFISGLPMILYSRMPGQEEGNVTYVIEEGAGKWAPEPELVVEALKSWINQPKKRKAASEACLRLARPDAARQIARILAAQALKGVHKTF